MKTNKQGKEERSQTKNTPHQSLEIENSKQEKKNSFFYYLFCCYCCILQDSNENDDIQNNNIQEKENDQQKKEIKEQLPIPLIIDQIAEVNEIKHKPQNSITSQITNIKVQERREIINQPKQTIFTIATKLINFSYLLLKKNDQHDNDLENNQINIPLINQSYNQLTQTQIGSQNLMSTYNQNITLTKSTQSNLLQQSHSILQSSQFLSDQSQYRHEDIPQYQPQQTIEYFQEQTQNSPYSDDSIDVMKTQINYSHCQHCKQQINGIKIQTNCFHDYHQECFEEMIEKQVFNVVSPYISCYCQKKLNLQILFQINKERQKQIREQIYQNQIQQIKKGLSDKGLIKNCKTKNCEFFFINHQEKESFCPSCKK